MRLIRIDISEKWPFHAHGELSFQRQNRTSVATVPLNFSKFRQCKFEVPCIKGENKGENPGKIFSCKITLLKKKLNWFFQCQRRRQNVWKITSQSHMRLTCEKQVWIVQLIACLTEWIKVNYITQSKAACNERKNCVWASKYQKRYTRWYLLKM